MSTFLHKRGLWRKTITKFDCDLLPFHSKVFGLYKNCLWNEVPWEEQRGILFLLLFLIKKKPYVR